MTGLDTGFFFELVRGNEAVVALHRDLIRHERGAALSSITVFEILRHGLRGSLERDLAEEIVAQAGVAFQVAGVDEAAVLRRAAAVAHGMGLAMADALIAASLERVGCTQLHTADSDFAAYDGPMEVVFIQ